jgi:epoxyqueuosine reductase
MKKVNTVEKGAERYVTGTVEPYDQKNEMFKRPFWDPKVQKLGEKFYIESVPPKDQPGYRLYDKSLVDASWTLENSFGGSITGDTMGMYSWEALKGFHDTPTQPGAKLSIDNPAVVTRQIKKAATFFGASLVGVCSLDRRWLYSSAFVMTREGPKIKEIDVPEDINSVIVIAIEMDYDAISHSPTSPSSGAVGLGYSKMAFTAGLLAQYIRKLGFKALPCGNDTGCSIPMAIDAGLGEMARNGLLITPEFGPRVRLAKIFTDMPLMPDKPIEFGVWDFCMICGKCADKCPSNSIVEGEPTVEPHNISNREGVHVWHINAETCFSFWAQNGTDCSNCIRVCPFNKPKGCLHDMVRWSINNLRWADRLMLWGDDIAGYGKQKDPDAFWI